MFKNTFQAGYLSILYSLGSRPLQLWEGENADGVKMVRDEDLQSEVVEVMGENIADVYITCPSHPKKTLGIKLPYIVLLVKNMHKYFSFEIEALDDKKLKRRFRASNYQTQARVKPYICTMPLRLSEGWNQVQLNIADLMRKAYGTTFVEISRVQVHANCRLRRIYFAEKPHAEEELPPEFKLFLPSESKRSAVLG
ncbi:flagellar associated protein [Acanthamoeba castellanii str. Neff]|uniref:Flagellar associated protein n=1 Tax=Acanthamoeba castellanii (strain ATCC 30010 / Neff) TaxID=1257118 RepID=L8H7B1_ACACF|nr:flagellar associated protein [Acanthamoeba castellanii str. Neff]ELR21102.1 flagellar associated protein [Acanthamoeba castellanii str. Neff]